MIPAYPGSNPGTPAKQTYGEPRTVCAVDMQRYPGSQDENLQGSTNSPGANLDSRMAGPAGVRRREAPSNPGTPAKQTYGEPRTVCAVDMQRYPGSQDENLQGSTNSPGANLDSRMAGPAGVRRREAPSNPGTPAKQTYREPRAVCMQDMQGYPGARVRAREVRQIRRERIGTAQNGVRILDSFDLGLM